MGARKQMQEIPVQRSRVEPASQTLLSFFDCCSVRNPQDELEEVDRNYEEARRSPSTEESRHVFAAKSSPLPSKYEENCASKRIFFMAILPFFIFLSFCFFPRC